ncbi:MAG TPA: hypothetical protein VF406_04440 [Thermodesulfobacteriota bacterium]
MITQSQGWSMKGSTVFDVWPETSIPMSAMAVTASGWTRVASVLAEASRHDAGVIEHGEMEGRAA